MLALTIDWPNVHLTGGDIGFLLVACAIAGGCIVGLILTHLDGKSLTDIYTRMRECNEAAMARQRQRAIAYGIEQFRLGYRAGRIAELRERTETPQRDSTRIGLAALKATLLAPHATKSPEGRQN